MAFSTQKDFFHMPFISDSECRKACVRLKSYESTTDDRSWAMDESEPSKYLADLVKCKNTLNTDGNGVGDRDTDRHERGRGPALRAKREEGVAGTHHGGGSSPEARQKPNIGAEDFNFKQDLQLLGADSVLECANKNLTILNELLSDKRDLQQKLELSDSRYKIAQEENEKIKNIMIQKFDPSYSKDFHNKIQKLASSGKINNSEEKELLNISYKIEEMYKSYEVLQAENYYLKRMVEKLSARATLNSIPDEPETSKDVSYLQNQVNAMRKELILLRKTEDDRLKANQNASTAKVSSNKDAERLKGIIDERNALREKCKSLKGMEKKIRELQKKAQEAENFSNGLSQNLGNQTNCINDMEKEMQHLQDYYEKQVQKLKYSEELLKCQVQELKDELCRVNCKAQKAECLQMEIGCLRNELLKRELALGDYDCQYKQLMFVVDELRNQNSVEIQNLQDTQTQTVNDNVEDLAFFASATLTEIMKELNKRGFSPIPGQSKTKVNGDFKKEDLISRDSTKEDLKPDSIKESLKKDYEKKEKPDEQRVPKAFDNIDTEKIANIDECKKLLEDAFEALKELEDKYDKIKKDAAELREENKRLKESMNEKKGFLDKITDKVNQIGQKVDKQGKDTANVEKDLEESIQLVKDISDITLKNQKLADEVKAITLREDQKIIDDLRKQLQEEMEKNAQLRKENAECQNSSKEHRIGIPKSIEERKKDHDKHPGFQSDDGAAKKRSSRPQVETDLRADAAKTDREKVEDGKPIEAGQVTDKSPQPRDEGETAGKKPTDRVGGKKYADQEPLATGKAVDGPKTTESGEPKRGDGKAPNQVGGKKDVDKKPIETDKPADASKANESGETSDKTVGKKDVDGVPIETGKATESDEPKGDGRKADQIVGRKDDVGKPIEIGKVADSPKAIESGEPKGEDKTADKKKTDQTDGRKDADGKPLEPVKASDGPKATERGKMKGDVQTTDQSGGRKDAGEKPSDKTDGKKDTEREPIETFKVADGPRAIESGKPKGDGQITDQTGGSKGADGKPIETGIAAYGPKATDGGKPKGEGKTADHQIGGSKDADGKPIETGKVADSSKATGSGPLKGESKTPDGKATDQVDDKKDSDGKPIEANKMADSIKGFRDISNVTGTIDGGIASTGQPGEGLAGKTGDKQGKSDENTRFTKVGDATAMILDEEGSYIKPDESDKSESADQGKRKLDGRSGTAGKGSKPQEPFSSKYQEFVDKNVTNLSQTLFIGHGLEAELKKILDDFISECGYFLCRCSLPKSKFYAICHKILHHGINSLSFREIAYLHKKLFMAAEKLHPGCLLSMMLADQCGAPQNSMADKRLKCCTCKNTLCCINSEEMLKEKVYKLERDIEKAKEYLNNFKTHPQHSNRRQCNRDDYGCEFERRVSFYYIAVILIIYGFR